MKFNRKLALSAAGAVAAVSLVGGGVAFAAASQGAGSAASNTADANSAQAAAGEAPQGPMGGGMGGHTHTPVTGDELTKVTDAISAYDSSITVESVEKDEDGTYDVHGTKDGTPVHLDVSADLATITEGMGGPGGGMGGPPPGESGAPGGETSGTTSSNPADANGTT
ncbi:MAG: hypothetical protein KBB39_08345 [Phycicoccus sp.]|nr:hypothetical protein [Phycicoccus sp.]